VLVRYKRSNLNQKDYSNLIGYLIWISFKRLFENLAFSSKRKNSEFYGIVFKEKYLNKFIACYRYTNVQLNLPFIAI